MIFMNRTNFYGSTYATEKYGPSNAKRVVEDELVGPDIQSLEENSNTAVIVIIVILSVIAFAIGFV